MKISMDGGALCSPSSSQFGNYTFTSSLIEALSQFDKTNQYDVYSFCDGKDFSQNIRHQQLLPTTAWMQFRVSWEEFKHPHDVFLALNQSIPLYTKAKIISFSHGLSFMKYPKLYLESYGKMMRQYDNYMRLSDYIIVSSQKVKDEMVVDFPAKKDLIHVLPFGISETFQTSEEKKREKFFLFVGMNHPIKNIPFLLKMFQKFIEKPEYKDYKLYLVGPFKEYASDNVKVFQNLSKLEMKTLYQTATGYLTASHYESFNFPVVEALSQHCPVIGLHSAIIPELAQNVNIPHNEQEFVDYMEQIAQGNYQKIDVEAIKQRFSWKYYVESLIKLY